MSNDTQNSAVALRHLIVSALTSPHGDSITGINTAKLPSGAECFVNATGGVYRLDKSLVTAPGASPAFITPTTGPGIWVLQGQSPAPASLSAMFNGTATMNAAPSAGPVVNTWLAMPAGSGFYQGSSTYFAIDAATGIITYSGPARAFVITGDFAPICVGSSELLEVALTLNGASIGTTDFFSISAETNMILTNPVAVSLSQLLTLNPGNTIQHIFRNKTGEPDTVTFKRYSVVIQGA